MPAGGGKTRRRFHAGKQNYTFFPDECKRKGIQPGELPADEGGELCAGSWPHGGAAHEPEGFMAG
jgi:hypothetical protein